MVAGSPAGTGELGGKQSCVDGVWGDQKQKQFFIFGSMVHG